MIYFFYFFSSYFLCLSRELPLFLGIFQFLQYSTAQSLEVGSDQESNLRLLHEHNSFLSCPCRWYRRARGFLMWTGGFSADTKPAIGSLSKAWLPQSIQYTGLSVAR